MMRHRIEPELEEIVEAHKQLSRAIMAEMNTRGVLYSSFTIQERIARTAAFCEVEFTNLAQSFNTKKDQSKINLCFDQIIKEEKSSLKTFCKSMKNISCNAGDFKKFMALKRRINNVIIQKRKNRLIKMVTLAIAALTLVVSTISVVQWFLPNPYVATDHKELQNEQ